MCRVALAYDVTVSVPLRALLALVEELKGLLQANGDHSCDDGRDVDEEVSPPVRGVMRRANISYFDPSLE